MIKTTDLRIGNIVSSNIFLEEKPMIVYSIGFENCSVGAEVIKDRWRNSFKDHQLEPIKLTEEILLKCGFKKVFNNEYEHDNVMFELFNNHGCYDARIEDAYLISKVKYLHQLQNLYYALTGDDLEVKL